MDFAAMRETVSVNIFDFASSAFEPNELSVYVNQAMHHIESQVAIVDKHLMLTTFEAETEIPNLSNAHFVVHEIDPKARRIVSAQRVDGDLDSDDIALEVISFKDAEKEATGSALTKPKVFLFNQDLGFVRPPESGFRPRVYYTQVLPDMIADDDTPGQTSGGGTVNVLPVQYHHLITSYATLLALAAENSPIEQWQGIYSEQAAAMGLDIYTRGRTQEGKNVHVR